MTYKKELKAALELIFAGMGRLKASVCDGPAKRCQFTIDGRLVGDIGEYVACMEYDLTLDDTSRPGYDGKTSDGRSVAD